MDDILLLEDDDLWQILMTDEIPDGLTYKLVEGGKRFEEYLSNGGQARLYFLDDEVPDASGIVGFHFIKNCTYLFERRPNARVLYTGSSPGEETYEYCKKHGISLIDKKEFGNIIRRGLFQEIFEVFHS